MAEELRISLGSKLLQCSPLLYEVISFSYLGPRNNVLSCIRFLDSMFWTGKAICTHRPMSSCLVTNTTYCRLRGQVRAQEISQNGYFGKRETGQLSGSESRKTLGDRRGHGGEISRASNSVHFGVPEFASSRIICISSDYHAGIAMRLYCQLLDLLCVDSFA